MPCPTIRCTGAQSRPNGDGGTCSRG
jgi:hypothetical protein